MRCVQCGAELRPNARFCNTCGAHQPELADAADATDATDASETPAAGAGRRKRPPRVPRVLDDDANARGEDDSQRAVDTAGPQAVSADAEAEAPVALATDRLPELAHAHDGAENAGMPEASPAGESEPQPLDWADAETIESSTVLSPAGPRVTVPTRPVRSGAGGQTGMPALDDLAKPASSGTRERAPAGAAGESWEDGLPWPLPPSIIVGGRYRVEALVSASPDPASGENVYTVTDLQGYERCWSCGTRYDASAGTDRFCRECGADMLAREYVMRERQLSPTADTTDPADAASAAAPVAETKETSAAEAAQAPSETAATDDAEERSFTQGARAYHVAPKASAAPAFPRGVHLVYGAATDVGASRPGEDNEDSLGVLSLGLAHESRTRSLLLAVVADGLGGHARGQDASRLVVRTLVEYVAQNIALPLSGDRVGDGADGADAAGEQARAALVDGARKANVALCQLNADQGVDMGSTLVAALIVGETAYIANAGDSRAYALDGGELRRITSDHSLVEQLIAGGLIRPDERYTHPQRNQIYRSLGGEPDESADVFEQRLAPGMRLLLCSDGLWEMVRDDELARILRETPHPQDACDALIRAANAHGGEDNIAALVVEVRA
jgi:serine/threonine protein phosphatase PrpC